MQNRAADGGAADLDQFDFSVRKLADFVGLSEAFGFSELTEVIGVWVGFMVRLVFGVSYKGQRSVTVSTNRRRMGAGVIVTESSAHAVRQEGSACHRSQAECEPTETVSPS